MGPTAASTTLTCPVPQSTASLTCGASQTRHAPKAPFLHLQGGHYRRSRPMDLPLPHPCCRLQSVAA
jgi:hypothetical protein